VYILRQLHIASQSVCLVAELMCAVGVECRYSYCEKCFDEIVGDEVELVDDPSQPVMYVPHCFVVGKLSAVGPLVYSTWKTWNCWRIWQLLGNSREKILDRETSIFSFMFRLGHDQCLVASLMSPGIENIGYFWYFRYVSDIFDIFILQHWIGWCQLKGLCLSCNFESWGYQE